jgi:hypothetical protein
LNLRRDAVGELLVCQVGVTELITLQYANSRAEVIVADGGRVGAVGVGLLFDDTNDSLESRVGITFDATVSSVSGADLIYTGDSGEGNLAAGMLIHNETEGEYATIQSINTGTNTITVTDGGDIAGWASPDNLAAVAILAKLWNDSGTATLRLDPGNAFADDKLMIGSASISVTATGDDDMVILLTGGGDLYLDPNDTVLIGDSTAMGPSSFVARGLIIDQATGGTHIIELDSTTDVAHGCTTLANTQTFGVGRKISDTVGGLAWDGYTEGEYAIALMGRYTTADTVKTSAAKGAVSIWAQEISGTGITNCTANQNVVVIHARKGGSDPAIWFVDVEGDTYRDGTENTFDRWDDVQLVRAFDREMAPDQLIDSQFDHYMRYNRQHLLNAGILTDPHGMFYNESKLIRLHNGAIWQLWQNFMACVQALEDMGVPMSEYLPNFEPGGVLQ